MVDLLDGYVEKGGHHLNVNVLNRELLIDAMENPDKYPLLTIRLKRGSSMSIIDSIINNRPYTSIKDFYQNINL